MRSSQERAEQAIQVLIEKLNQESKRLPRTLGKNWFSSELFTCRSENTCDYLHEIRDNLQKLNSMKADSTSYKWLLQHLDAQLNAFTQAIYRAKRPPAQTYEDHHAAKSQRISGLHQELAKHHEYERRLEENLRIAQQAPPSAQQTTQLQHCQQRLLRCQRAIAAIEERIRRAEG